MMTGEQDFSAELKKLKTGQAFSLVCSDQDLHLVVEKFDKSFSKLFQLTPPPSMPLYNQRVRLIDGSKGGSSQSFFYVNKANQMIAEVLTKQLESTKAVIVKPFVI